MPHREEPAQRDSAGRGLTDFCMDLVPAAFELRTVFTTVYF